MAKTRRLNSSGDSRKTKTAGRSARDSKIRSERVSWLDPATAAMALVAGTVVYVVCHPSDSVAVEQGDALWFAALSLLCLVATQLMNRRSASDSTFGGETRLLQMFNAVVGAAPWVLAAWMMLAAFAVSPPGNLRNATNEAWLWISMAALFTAARRLSPRTAFCAAMLALIIACSTGLASYGLYQQFIILPNNQQAYVDDPEAVLRTAGVEAPAGSTERMIFRDRLFDGGPTATFALANSFAGVLLVGVVLSFGLLKTRWFEVGWAVRVAWLASFLVAGSCLLATRSRSALLASAVGVLLAAIIGSADARLRGRTLRIMASALALLLAGLGAALTLFGDPEWFQQAPASVAFRLRYWRSTLALAWERPLFGAGPGNFQSIYERYRLPSMHEQIAEPHNFVLETLASGGWPAAIILLLAFVAGGLLLRIRGPRHEPAGETDQTASAATGQVVPVVGGALVSLLFVFTLGLLTGTLPDFDAYLIAIPIALLVGAATVPRAWQGMGSDRSPAIAALLALLLHLSASGGWTVPGVGLWAWLLAALAIGPPTVGAGEQRPLPSSGLAWLSGNERGWSQLFQLALAVLLLIGLYLMSLRPVEKKRLAILRAEIDQRAGRRNASEAHLLEALDADPWSADAALWLADTYRWNLVRGSGSRQDREAWESAVQEAKRRAGDDPATFRLLGGMQLHLYQRYGALRDLRAADETLSAAAHWSPSHQWLAAQAAVVANALGEREKQLRYASRARHLADLGNYVARDLDRQLVFEAKRLGESVRDQPSRVPASRVLNQIEVDNVPVENE